MAPRGTAAGQGVLSGTGPYSSRCAAVGRAVSCSAAVEGTVIDQPHSAIYNHTYMRAAFFTFVPIKPFKGYHLPCHFSFTYRVVLAGPHGGVTHRRGRKPVKGISQVLQNAILMVWACE